MEYLKSLLLFTIMNNIIIKWLEGFNHPDSWLSRIHKVGPIRLSRISEY